MLISPFATIQEVAADFISIGSSMVTNYFNNLEELKEFKGRLLVIHGEADNVINVRHGKMIIKQQEKQH